MLHLYPSFVVINDKLNLKHELILIRLFLGFKLFLILFYNLILYVVLKLKFLSLNATSKPQSGEIQKNGHLKAILYLIKSIQDIKTEKATISKKLFVFLQF